MEINITTALEIFKHPGNLEVAIWQEKGESKFTIGIFLGHLNTPLLTSQTTEKREDAMEAIRETLESICEAATKYFADRKSLPSQYLNPDGLEIDQSKVLNSELITRILEELRQHRVASTCKMLTPTRLSNV